MDIREDLRLSKSNRESVKNAQSNIVNEVKGLLAENAADKRKILKNMGMDTQVKVASERIGNQIDLEKLEETYGEVYTKDEIKKICIDYKLRFASASLYKGNISADLPSVIMRFCKKHNINTDDPYLGDSFKIVAPLSNFDLLERPKDPLLFYRPNRSKDFVLVHKWGNDFTWTRYAMAWTTKSLGTLLATRIMITAIITSVFVSSFGAHTFGLCSIYSAFTSTIITIITLIGHEDKKIKYNDKNWDSNYK